MEKEKKKVKAKILVNDYNIENKGIIVNEILKVKDNETTILFDYENLILTREDKEKKLILDFKNELLTYSLKELPNKFYSNLTILSLTNYNKRVMIRYQIEENEFSLSINIETSSSVLELLSSSDACTNLVAGYIFTSDDLNLYLKKLLVKLSC